MCLLPGAACFSDITRALHALAVLCNPTSVPSKLKVRENRTVKTDAVHRDDDVITSFDRLNAWYSFCELQVRTEQCVIASTSCATPTKQSTRSPAGSPRAPNLRDVRRLARNLLWTRVIERRYVDKCLACIKMVVRDLIASNSQGDVTIDRRESTSLHRKASGDSLPMDSMTQKHLSQDYRTTIVSSDGGADSGDLENTLPITKTNAKAGVKSDVPPMPRLDPLMIFLKLQQPICMLE